MPAGSAQSRARGRSSVTHFETILYEKLDRIARITLNRPHRLNAFDSVMRAELPQAWRDNREDPTVTRRDIPRSTTR
jgi:E-phenylitaconyl-CoA hydratase